ncbi:TRAP transporter substrate-binding protein DctP [Chloroflexota bacterium]
MPEITWNLSVWGSPRSWTSGVDKFVELVSDGTDGKFNIKLNYGGVLAPGPEGLDGIRAGSFEAAVILPSFHPGKTPLSNVLRLPFLDFKSLEVMGHVTMELHHENPALVQELKFWDARVVLPIANPPMNFMGNKPIATMDDFVGLRIGTYGTYLDVAKKLGATPVDLPIAELYEGLDRNIADVCFLTPSSLISYGIVKTSKYMSDYPISGNPSLLVVSQSLWEDLPAEYKKVLEDAWQPAYDYSLETHNASYGEALKQIEAEGIEIVHISPEVGQQIVELGGAPVWKEWAEKQALDGHDGQSVVDAMVKKMDEVNKRFGY